MWFDKTKIYTAVNADEVKVGSKGYIANSLEELREMVDSVVDTTEIVSIRAEDFAERFAGSDNNVGGLFYLVEEPKEKTYRPYKDTNEMIEDFLERYNSHSGNVNVHNPMYSPFIWVKPKDTSLTKFVRRLITDFTEDGIYLSTHKQIFVDLFEDFTYLDGTPCGKMEE